MVSVKCLAILYLPTTAPALREILAVPRAGFSVRRTLFWISARTEAVYCTRRKHRSPTFDDPQAKPNLVSRKASINGLYLRLSEVHEMALDLSESMDAMNSFEKMLVHQLATSQKSVIELRSQLHERLSYNCDAPYRFVIHPRDCGHEN
jgi:hypothetical protein